MDANGEIVSTGTKRPAVKLLDVAMMELADGIGESLDAIRERIEREGE